VSVEYEEEKPKTIKAESGRKRRMLTKDVIDVHQQQPVITQPAISPVAKQAPSIILDDKSQDHIMKIDNEEAKNSRADEAKKLDKFEIFGLFVADEMRSLSSPALQNKFKRRILQCILEINDDASQS
jgi:hypothetical protein